MGERLTVKSEMSYVPPLLDDTRTVLGRFNDLLGSFSAAKLRARCGFVRWSPLFSSQHSRGRAPQVAQ